MDIKIDKTASDQRFDRFLRKWFKKYPKIRLSDIYSIIRKWSVKVNNKRVKEQYRLLEGDIVQINDKVSLWTEDLSLLVSQKERKLEKVDIKKISQQILYEDAHWIVFDKPAWIPMHPGNKHRNDLSMNDCLDVYAKQYKTATFKPSFWYRLDRDTSWVLIAGKTYEALQYINTIIRERKIDKYYLAIVVGKFPGHVVIDKPLTKSYSQKFDRSQVKIDYQDGLASKTECWVEQFLHHPLLGSLSLLKVKIHTWRMHQIRVHVADQWYPVLGDLVYGNQSINKILCSSLQIRRQLLHCQQYSFFDPFEEQNMVFTSPLPVDFQKILKK